MLQYHQQVQYSYHLYIHNNIIMYLCTLCVYCLVLYIYSFIKPSFRTAVIATLMQSFHVQLCSFRLQKQQTSKKLNLELGKCQWQCFELLTRLKSKLVQKRVLVWFPFTRRWLEQEVDLTENPPLALGVDILCFYSWFIHACSLVPTCTKSRVD